jgi:hypothetical protein
MPAVNVREQQNATEIHTSAVILNATPLERRSKGLSLAVCVCCFWGKQSLG